MDPLIVIGLIVLVAAAWVQCTPLWKRIDDRATDRIVAEVGAGVGAAGRGEVGVVSEPFPYRCGRLDKHEPHTWHRPGRARQFACSGHVITEGAWAAYAREADRDDERTASWLLSVDGSGAA